MRFQVQELFVDFHSGDETHVMFYYGWLNFWIKCSERLPEASGKIEAIIRPVTGVSHDVCCWARFQPYCTCIINTANRLDTNKTGGNAKRAFQSRKSPKSCRALQSYKTPGDWARELSKPSTHSASLVVKIEKKRFSFLVGDFWTWRHKEGMFWNLATFGRPWAPTHWPTLLAQSFVEN